MTRSSAPCFREPGRYCQLNTPTLVLSTRMALCSRCHSILQQNLAVRVPSSPVPELIRRHCSPSSSQISSIEQAIAGAQSNAHELDVQISNLENALEDLRRRRAALECFTQEHQAILAPMRRLPPEILGDIFNLCLHGRWQERVFDIRQAPLLLSQVCIGWRDIALANTKLWSTISIYLQSSCLKSESALVKTWLDRAGGHPLSIRLVDPWQRASHPVFDLISSCSDRWQHVELVVAQSFFESLNLGVSTLESASFPEGAWGNQSINTFLAAPRLRSLLVGFPASPYMTQLPWDQLTELHLHELQLEMCLEIIRQSLNLISCDLTIRSWMEPIPSVTCQILLPQLRFLRVKASSDMGDLFDHLTLPALLEIQLVIYGIQGAAWVDQFISSLHRSSCSVQKLHLECDRPVSDDHLLQCLRNTPSLTMLELRGYNASNLGKSGMNQLTCRASSRPDTTSIIPNLRTIILQYYNDLTFDDEAFVDMIASRWKFDATASGGQIARLQTVHVSIFRHSGVVSSKEMLGCLRAFRGEGLDICLRAESCCLSLLDI